MANPIPAFDTNHLKAIPEFDGTTQVLSRFINSCELLLTHFYNPDPAQANCYQNVLILHCLLGKLVGNAKLAIDSQPVNTWAELKDILTRNFSDVRNEENLIIDLTNMRQGSHESAQLFYERCLTQLSALNARCTIHEPVANRAIKTEQYNKLTLSIFLNGLNEPLRTNILNMKPNTLPEAIYFIRERENNNLIFSRQKSHSHNNNKHSNKFKNQNYNNFNNNFQYQQPFNRHHSFGNRTFQNPSNNYNQNPFNHSFNNPFNNSRPFNQQNHFNNQHPNRPNYQQYNQPRNVFTSNPNFKPSYTPTPMSGISNNSSNKNRNGNQQNFSYNIDHEPSKMIHTQESIINSKIADIRNNFPSTSSCPTGNFPKATKIKSCK